jgi:hydroxyethylthiazole kinase-like uncharacterized protein yjeF
MLEILTPAEMAEADRRTIAAGTPGIALMERAGRAVAQAAQGLVKPGASIAVVCGPGNNGGDGFVAARLLRELGFKIDLVLMGRREALAGDAALAADGWRGEVHAFGVLGRLRPQLIVDALFGAGLSRPLTGEAQRLVQMIAQSQAPVLAVDLPSGIDGLTGQVRGIAVRAVRTVTFCRKKPGHLLLPGRLHCGQVTVADIGIADAAVTAGGPKLFHNMPALWSGVYPWPQPDGHKYVRGHAVVMSGPPHATGAARLAANAALRAGAGLVSVAGAKAALPALSAGLTAVMVREAGTAETLKKLLADARMNAVLLGPAQGVGKPTRACVEAAAAARRALVLDADAISSFTEESETLAKILKSLPVNAVLTPHDGEFARLFAKDVDVLSASSKVERVRLAAKKLGAVVVLKGADTVVAAPDGKAAIADNAPPWLATAGSGDVLAGIITGLIAQRMPPFEAAAAAVWLHGEAANEAGIGLIAEDLPAALRPVLVQLYEEHGAARMRPQAP